MYVSSIKGGTSCSGSYSSALSWVLCCFFSSVQFAKAQGDTGAEVMILPMLDGFSPSLVMVDPIAVAVTLAEATAVAEATINSPHSTIEYRKDARKERGYPKYQTICCTMRVAFTVWYNPDSHYSFLLCFYLI